MVEELGVAGVVAFHSGEEDLLSHLVGARLRSCLVVDGDAWTLTTMEASRRMPFLSQTAEGQTTSPMVGVTRKEVQMAYQTVA